MGQVVPKHRYGANVLRWVNFQNSARLIFPLGTVTKLLTQILVQIGQKLSTLHEDLRVILRASAD
jgi:hypothetical protein